MKATVKGFFSGLFFCLTIFLAAILNACSSSATPSASIPAPVSGLASTSAVTSSLTSSLGSFTGGALVKAQTDDGDIDYSCAVSEDFSTVECDCPLGGYYASAYDDAFALGEDCDDGTTSVVFSSVYAQAFYDCAVEKCGGTVTLDGLIGGIVEGSFECDGTIDITASLFTMDEEANELTCSGITATPEEGDAVHVGFNADFTFDGVDENFSGSFCTDPPGEPDGLIEFDSFDELETEADPDGTCEAAEEDDEE
ncbi:MAG: hypothetical protein HYU99_05245 [Deltaproteobacteria bacterium]|nr:hypothetical protein [Deltaproteobacteria bacterium]